MGPSSSGLSPRGGDGELEDEIGGEDRRLRARVCHRIHLVEGEAADLRRERDEEVEEFAAGETASRASSRRWATSSIAPRSRCS
jgi:hypothetical protein